MSTRAGRRPATPKRGCGARRRYPNESLASFSGGGRWQESTHEVPVPRLAPLTGARILQGLPLQTLVRQAHAAAIGEQQVPVGGHEMSHALAKPHVAVQPEAAFHRVDHSIAAACELPGMAVSGGVVEHGPTKLSSYWQASWPSTVAGAIGGAEPMKMAHSMG